MALDPETRVARRVAGRAQQVVDAGRGVRLERQDRPPPVGHELLAGQREEPAHEDPGVLGRVVLGDVVGAEGEQVADLPALGVDDAETASGGDPRAAPLARRDVDQVAHRCASAYAASVSTITWQAAIADWPWS